MNRPKSTFRVSIVRIKSLSRAPRFPNRRFVLLADSGVTGLAGTVRAAIVPYLVFLRWRGGIGVCGDVGWYASEVKW